MLPVIANNSNRVSKFFDDNIFESMFSPRLFENQQSWMQSWEDDNSWYMSFDLPGFTPEDVNLTVEADTLSLSANAKNRKSIQYMVSLPGYVSTDDISAQLENGVLSITLPKAEQAKPRRIEIKNSS